MSNFSHKNYKFIHEGILKTLLDGYSAFLNILGEIFEDIPENISGGITKEIPVAIT